MLVIDGERVAGDAGSYPVHNPARPAEVVGEAPAAGPALLDRAVAAARAALPGWAGRSVQDRAAAASAAAAGDDLGALLTREHGKVVGEARFEAASVAAIGALMAAMVDQALG